MEVVEARDGMGWGSISWIRAPEIGQFQGVPPKLFEGAVEPNDIQQRTLGDCYFLAVLSALAEKPERIYKFFDSSQENEHGVYAVNWFKNGIPTEVIVDDHIPCKYEGGVSRPCFSTSNKNELWVIILEKAWAKLHKDYVKVIAGLSHETFRDLTAAPSYLYQSAEDGVWEKI